MGFDTLPPEVACLILFHLDLDELIALKHTSQLYLRLVCGLDDQYIKPLVQKRVPWMEIGQPGTGLYTWMDAATRIVVRHKLLMNEPTTWINTERYSPRLRHVIGNTDINFVEPVMIKESLPDCKPMFNEKIYTYVGDLTGTHMQSRSGFTDLTTFTKTKTHPNPPKKDTWSGLLFSKYHGSRSYVTMPMSGLWVFNADKLAFQVTQETSEWILVDIRDEKYTLHTCVLDKSKAKGTVLIFGIRKSFRETICKDYKYSSDSVMVHFLPGKLGAIVFDKVQKGMVVVSYDDFGRSGDEVALVKLHMDFDEMRIYKGQEISDSPRQLVVTYGGVLYLHFQGYMLLPLWLELGSRDDYPKQKGYEDYEKYSPDSGSVISLGGTRQQLKSILLIPKPKDKDYRTNYGLARSDDGRWVSQVVSSGCIVADLATGKTFVVHDYYFCAFMFVGINEAGDRPVFYSCHVAAGLFSDPSKNGHLGTFLNSRHNDNYHSMNQCEPLNNTITKPPDLRYIKVADTLDIPSIVAGHGAKGKKGKANK